MKKRYSVAVVFYLIVMAIAVVLLIEGGEKRSGFIDFSGLASAFGIGIASAGTLLFGLYLLLVYSYSRGRRAFLITLSLLAGILMIGAGAGVAQRMVSQQQRLDFSSAIVLRPGVQHLESDHSQSLVRETKYKYLPERDGEIAVELMPVGRDDQISGLYVFDSRKKKIFQHEGIVPPRVKISGAVSGEWIYLIVQTWSAYDVYRITISQQDTA